MNLRNTEGNMFNFFVATVFLPTFVALGTGNQDKAGHTVDKDHVVVRPAALKWMPPPPGLPAGSQMAVLIGDPSKPGVPYVFRAKLPDGYKVPPHWHSIDENVTVLSGM